jgi:hypothetical protein
MAGARAGWPLAAALLIAACAAPSDRPGACPTQRGGEAGLNVQFRFVELGGSSVAFSFGLRSGETRFGVPAYELQPSPDGAIVSFAGANRDNPDGSPSYDGPKRIDAQAQGLDSFVREVTLDDAPAATLRSVVRATATACPRVLARSYVVGTTIARSVAFVVFGDDPAFTLEPTDGEPGKALQVSGLGFARKTKVTLAVKGQQVWESMTSDEGSLDTVLFLPELPPGRYEVVARDGSGRTARAWARILPRG